MMIVKNIEVVEVNYWFNCEILKIIIGLGKIKIKWFDKMGVNVFNS